MKKFLPANGILGVTLALLYSGDNLRAASFDWDGKGADNNWSTQQNWKPNNVPGPTDDVTFNKSAPFLSANVDVSTSIGEIIFAGSVGYTITGAGGNTFLTINGIGGTGVI